MMASLYLPTLAIRLLQSKSKSQYTSITGRTQGDKDVIAYHLRQSFKPNEIAPQTANKNGYDLAMSLTKGKHAFIVCTHIDKQHIHSHIIFNSTDLDCNKKFRNFWGSSFAIRKISDKLCLENGLSIIENPKSSKGHYGDWLGDRKPLTYSDKMRQVIDDALSQKPIDFNSFLFEMQSAGYEIKTGKHLAFKGKEQKKFIRLKFLGNGYSEDEIKAVISVKSAHKSKPQRQEKAVDMFVDIQAKLQQGKGAGYDQWAKVFNLKQMAQSINYLKENNLLDYEKLSVKADEITSEFDIVSAEIKTTEKQLSEIKELKNNIINYMKTKDTYAEYKQSGHSKKVYAKYEGELILHKAAKAHFDKLKLQKLPSIKSLQTQEQLLFIDKSHAYTMYKKAKKICRKS
ncbi:relaxase/mobilization nuclease domain-containing protein [Eubacterium sp. 1001713B170207_170306_E7]|uniref:relaxase/mobilization nuclease domain-containing protein n=1 Tax=Eubacterium sp. 1001713B170207_170306_E7 TaxID=2787097 RepID=UPI00325FD3E1